MSIQATGPVSEAMLSLESMIASSEAWQDRVDPGKSGSAAEDAAREKIYWGLVSGDSFEFEKHLPLIVLFVEDFTLNKIAGGERNVLVASANRINILVEDYSRFPGDIKQDMIDWHNFLGGLVEHLRINAAQDDQLAITEVQIVETMRTDPKGDVSHGTGFWQALMAVTCGV